MTNQTNDVQAMADRAGRLINALTDAIMSASEAAAERVQLASEVAKIQQRMAAFGAVLEIVGAQKSALLDQRLRASGPMAALLDAQLQALTAQELGILRKVGVAPEVAQLAVKTVDEPAPSPDPLDVCHAQPLPRGIRQPRRLATNGTGAH